MDPLGQGAVNAEVNQEDLSVMPADQTLEDEIAALGLEPAVEDTTDEVLPEEEENQTGEDDDDSHEAGAGASEEKTVPLSALQAERKKRQQLEEKNAQFEQVLGNPEALAGVLRKAQQINETHTPEVSEEDQLLAQLEVMETASEGEELLKQFAINQVKKTKLLMQQTQGITHQTQQQQEQALLQEFNDTVSALERQMGVQLTPEQKMEVEKQATALAQVHYLQTNSVGSVADHTTKAFKLYTMDNVIAQAKKKTAAAVQRGNKVAISQSRPNGAGVGRTTPDYSKMSDYDIALQSARDAISMQK
jgi:hypothetical protein